MTDKDCRQCKFWAYDMDLDPFCVHGNASPMGTDINLMRRTEKTPNMRGEPCGPEAKLFIEHKRKIIGPYDNP